MKSYPDTEWSDPVLGVLSPDPAGEILCTRYKRFRSPSGIDGLARRDGMTLELLAVIANEPGTGQFRRFIKQAQERFTTICIWHDLNPALGVILSKYGFTPEDDVDEFGQKLSGWRWDAPPNNL